VGVPEAHALFRANGKYLTMGINDFENHMKPVESEAIVHLIDNQRKLEAILDCMELSHGPIELWATGRRFRSQVRARQIFFWAMRTCTTYTLVEISNFVPGNYDHATIIHARKAIDNEIEMMTDDVVACVTQIALALEVNGCNMVLRRMNALMNRNNNRKILMKRNREIIS
jgi:hypothetical protein